MIKRPLLIFFVVVGVLIAGAIYFIQSPFFARALKSAASRYVPDDFGIEGDFSELSIRLFPPQIAAEDVRIRVAEHNIAGLPEGSTVTAKKINFKFRPFQLFTRSIRVHEVSIEEGEIALELDPELWGKQKNRDGLHWDELLKIRAESIALKNTVARIALKKPRSTYAFHAGELRLSQWEGKGGLGYEVRADLDSIQVDHPGVASAVGALPPLALRAHLQMNAIAAQIKTLEVSSEGASARISGKVSGNVLGLKSFPFDGDVEARAEIAKLAATFPKLLPKGLKPEGEASFAGTVRASLEKPLDTLRVEGTAKGALIRLMGWEIDQLSATGGFVSSAAGGEISVAKASVSAEPRARASGKPGSGGKVDVGAFKVRVGPGGIAERVTVPLALERVHLHWAAAPEVRKIFPLHFVASGPISAELVPGGSEKGGMLVRGLVDLKVEDFVLDNQGMGESVALTRILRMPAIKVTGPVAVDAGAFYANGAVVGIGSTKLVANGRVDFEAGFDLAANGVIDLKDVGTLVEKEIRGTGSVAARVHGPFTRVVADIFPELKDASYLDLALGDLKGQITIDEAPSLVLFEGITAKRGGTEYQGRGQIDIGEGTISLDTSIKQGNVLDVSTIFASLTQKLWWYPRTLVGGLEGDVAIRGGLGLDQLEVSGKFKGENWDYLGERFSSVSFGGGYDKGRFFVEGLKATKAEGSLQGRLSFDTHGDPASSRPGYFDWDLKGSKLTLSDIDLIARLDVPIRGKLSLQSAGKGTFGEIQSRTQIGLGSTAVRGSALPPSQLVFESAEGITRIEGTALGGQGAIEGSYDFEAGGRSHIKARLDGLDFSPAILLVNPKLIQDQNVTGLISGAVDLSFRSGELERASGTMSISEYVLSKSGSRFRLRESVSVRVNDGSFDLPSLALAGKSGEARLSLRSRQGNLSGNISGALDLSIIEFLVGAVAQAGGAADLDLGVGGSVKSPTLFGRAAVQGGNLRVGALESPFENISGTLLLREGVVTAQGIEADLATGRVSASGTVKVFTDRLPTVNLTANLGGNRIKVYPFQYAKVRGRVNVHGETRPYVIDGLVNVESALSRESFARQKGGVLKTARYMPNESSAQQGGSSWFRLNLKARGDGNLFMKNELMDAEGSVDVTLINTIEVPRVLGTAQIIQGKLLFKDRVFTIQSGDVVFDNPTTIAPRYNVTSVAEVNETKIQMYVSGVGEKMKIELTSEPAMAESEILSLLAIGLTQEEMKRLKASDQTLIEQGQAANLLLQSLDFNRDVQEKTGVRIDLEEAITRDQGTSVFRPQSQSESTAAPKLVIKRKILPKTELSVGATVGVGTNTQQEVSAEYQLNPNVSVQGVWNLLDNESTGEKPQSFGVDLKFQKRFK